MGKFKDYYPEAERLAVREGKTQRDISELLGVSEKTISKWSSDGQWLRQRKEYLVSTREGPAETLKKGLLKIFEETTAEELVREPGRVDQITKIISAIEKIEGGRDVLGSAIETMDKFTRYLIRVEQDKEIIKKIGEHIHRFFEEIRRG